MKPQQFARIERFQALVGNFRLEFFPGMAASPTTPRWLRAVPL
jgi:hypothetical protein